MRVEWSDAALDDLDRFALFLKRNHPSLARVVARAIIEKAAILADHPQLGRPLVVGRTIGNCC